MESSPQLRHVLKEMAENDPTKLPTPLACIAGTALRERSNNGEELNHDVDFCLVPIGTPTASVSKEVAEVQRLLKKSGAKYSMHSAGTTLGLLFETLSFDCMLDTDMYGRRWLGRMYEYHRPMP